MAVPASGQISLRGIRDEIGTNNYNGSVGYTNISLHTMSTGGNGTINTANSAFNRPDGSVPHNITEFYSYDHDLAASTRTSFSSGQYSSANCPASLLTTHYHDGSGTYPAIGDVIYASTSAIAPVGSGYYYFSQSQAAVITDKTNGIVTSLYTCPRSERRLKHNIELIGESPMGIPIYHFDYKDAENGVGRFIGTMVDDLERLGFKNALFMHCDGDIMVDYDMIDVPFHNVTI